MKKGFTLAEGATHVGICAKTRQYAFTLAEVLITLAIIGVVATMTISTLMQEYKDKVLETQKVKIKTTLTHAFKMLMAQNGTTDLRTTTIATCNNKSCYKTELEKVLRINSDISSADAKTRYTFSNGDKVVWNDGKVYTFLNNDGAIYGVENTNDDTYSFVVDVNGSKLPNTGGKDLCKFTITSQGFVSEECNTMISFEEVIGVGRKPVVGTATCLATDSSGKCTKCSSGGELYSGRCRACSAGKYSPYSTSTRHCSDCAAGQYSSTKTEICGICGPGTYSRQGSASCTKCPQGKYQNEAGAKSCKLCPTGTTTSSTGAVSISECK